MKLQNMPLFPHQSIFIHKENIGTRDINCKFSLMNKTFKRQKRVEDLIDTKGACGFPMKEFLL